MSHGTGLGQNGYQERDFVLATPEEFVKRFNGKRVINKVLLIIIISRDFNNNLFENCL